MEVLRQVGSYQLNKGDLMAKGLYNVTDQANDTSLEATAQMRVSYWFEQREANKLMALSNKEFKKECERMLTFRF